MFNYLNKRYLHACAAYSELPPHTIAMMVLIQDGNDKLTYI